MHKFGHRSRRAGVVAALSLVAGAAGVWSQVIAASNETIKGTVEALHASFINPETGEGVWIQADEAVINSSNVRGGPQFSQGLVLFDAWSPRGGVHGETWTVDPQALSVSARATHATLNAKDVPAWSDISPATTASIHATYHTATQETNRPANWTSPDGSTRVHRLDAFGTGAAGGKATVVMSDGTVIVKDVPASSEPDSAGNTPGVWKTSEVTHVKNP